MGDSFIERLTNLFRGEFTNVGKRIKAVAFITSLTVILCTSISVVEFFDAVSEDVRVWGWLIIAAGSILSELLFLGICGFGIIVESHEKNLEQYKTNEKELNNTSFTRQATNNWICKECGKSNPYYKETCGCGGLRPKERKQHAELQWKCDKCGEQSTEMYCPNCKTKKRPIM